jgi:ATP-dependent DNA helicase RecQ
MREQKLRQILSDTFGHEEFRFRQLEIMNSILDGHDTLAIMPTGGGKSMCYQIPALYCGGITLVISPLISLMQDQVINLQQNGVEACYLNSSLSSEERYNAEEKIKSGEVNLVYISPEGLLSSSRLTVSRLGVMSFVKITCVFMYLKTNSPRLPFLP